MIASTLLALYSFGVFDHTLWTPDEPRVAAVAREASEGAWLTPTLNGTPFLEQPPFFYWCTAVFFRTFGVDRPYRARLLSTLFCLGTLACTYGIARTLSGGSHRLGALSAASLAVSLEFFHLAHRLVVDSALTFATTAAAFAIAKAYAPVASGEAAMEAWRARFWLVAAGLSTSVAFLTKGIIGVAVPYLFLGAVVWNTGRWRLLVGGYLWTLLVLMALVAGPWFYLVWLERGGEAFHELFVHNTLGRVLPWLAGERAHVRPFFYYLVLPFHLLPAFFFGMGALVHRFRGNTFSEPERLVFKTAVLWLVGGVVMLSLASTKRQVYFLPFFPGFALLAGLWLNVYLRGEGGSAGRIVTAAVSVLLLAMGGAVSAAPVFVAEAPVWLVGVGGVAVAGVVRAHACARRGRRGAALEAQCVSLVLVAVLALWGLVPVIDRIKRLDNVALAVDAQVPRSESLYVFEADETTLAMMSLYVGRRVIPVEGAEGLEEAVRERGSEIFVLAVDKTYRERKRRFEVLEALGGEVLMEDVRPRSRTFRLVRVGRGRRP